MATTSRKKRKQKELVFYMAYDERDEFSFPLCFETLDEIAEKLNASRQTIKNALSTGRRVANIYSISKSVIRECDLI